MRSSFDVGPLNVHIILSAAFVIALLSGCGTTPKHSGDFGAFLQRELIARGARIPSNAPALAITGVWTFSPDEYGFVAHLRADRFTELDNWFHSTFGEPKISVDRNDERQPQRVYSAEAVGVPVQYVREEGGVTVVCVKRFRW
jgi:hypothetical protein